MTNYQRYIGLYLMFTAILGVAGALFNFAPIVIPGFSNVFNYLIFPVALIGAVLGQLPLAFNYAGTLISFISSFIVGAIGYFLYQRSNEE